MKQPTISGGQLIECLSDVSDAHRPRRDRRGRVCIWHCVCGFGAHSDTEMGAHLLGPLGNADTWE
ncbi:MAG TPA: hypothetical protein VHG90_02115 [Acidimicrobiales bacterium]|nr:hypothetical protein [Acidimicrobiales bacterium]